MKPLTIFESAIIGFFVGVIAAAYAAFVTGTGGFLGQILGWVSLKPVFDMLKLSESYQWVGAFVFMVLVFTIYGALVGAILKFSRGKKTLASVGVVAASLLIAIAFEQGSMPASKDVFAVTSPDTASVISSIEKRKKPQQYFGTEAVGDLNADGVDDIAFIISRDDEERGTLYYLAAALATTSGRSGTNLIFLGEKIEPYSISISQSIISIAYNDLSEKNSSVAEDRASTPSKFSYITAIVTGGKLEKFIPSAASSTPNL